MNYSEALQYLDDFLNYEQVIAYRYPQAFSLDRMRDFLKKLGNPHERFNSLHAAGTKGKGSTCAFAASILQAHGLRVGLYTSPHLALFQERIRVNGEPIPEERLAEVVTLAQPSATEGLTFFEVTTACAFLYFAQEAVDVAVVEVGLGGRLDATNVLTPRVSAVTPISLDHVEKLGGTLSAIAREKAGIVKTGVPVVIAPQEEEALSVLSEVADARGAPVHLVQDEVQIREPRLSREGTACVLQTPRGIYSNLTVPLLGRHQLFNAATALRMVELLFDKERKLRLTPEAAREGLRKTFWPGRCQWIPGSPAFLLDGAQNAASAEALSRTIGELFGKERIVLVIGVSLEKDLAGIARALGPLAAKLIVTQAQVPRAESPEKIREYFSPWHPDPILTHSVGQALDQAREMAGPQDLIVAAGSLFVVGEALQVLTGGAAFEVKTGSRR